MEALKNDRDIGVAEENVQQSEASLLSPFHWMGLSSLLGL
jgi:hypothetical protein